MLPSQVSDRSCKSLQTALRFGFQAVEIRQSRFQASGLETKDLSMIAEWSRSHLCRGRVQRRQDGPNILSCGSIILQISTCAIAVHSHVLVSFCWLHGIEMASMKIALCEAHINYIFINRRLCAAALYTFSGVCQDLGVYINKNDTLAVLGDAVLQQSLCEQWYSRGLTKGTSLSKHALRSTSD